MDESLRDHPVLGPIARDEVIRAAVQAGYADVVVTERRLVIASEARVMMDVEMDNVRRIQFDIERVRPATLVVVPEHSTHAPQVIAVPPEQYERVAHLLVVLGQHLAGTPDAES